MKAKTMKVICFDLQQKHYMDKFSYAIGLGIGQNLLSMGAKGIAVDDFAQAIKDVLEGNQTAISHQEAREIVNKYFEELEAKMGAAAIEQGKAFLEENKKKPGVVTLPSGLQYEVINEGTGKKAKATDQVKCHYEGTLIDGTLFYQARRTGCIRRQSGNPGMGGSIATDARRFQMETLYSVRPCLWRQRCRRNDSSPQHIGI